MDYAQCQKLKALHLALSAFCRNRIVQRHHGILQNHIQCICHLPEHPVMSPGVGMDGIAHVPQEGLRAFLLQYTEIPKMIYQRHFL